jgi:hypothetical protein
MQVTLSTGKEFEIEPLKVAQCRRIDEAEKAGRGLDSVSQACSDAIRNAGGTMTPGEIEEILTISELRELYVATTNASGLTVGEAKAAR